MSKSDDRNLIDDQAFEEYLGRGSSLSQRYRDSNDEEPPRALDERVLGMAREAVAQPAPSKSGPRWVRWSAPLALAASAVLVVSIVIESGVYQETTTLNAPASAQLPVKSEPLPEPALHDHAEYERVYAAPAEAPADAELIPPASPVAEEQRKEVITSAARSREQKAARESRADALPVAPDQVAVQPQFAPTPPPASVAPPAASAAPSNEEQATLAATESDRRFTRTTSENAASSVDAELSEVLVTGAQRPREIARRSGPRSTVRPSDAGASADMDREQSSTRDPEEWLDEIRALREAGRDAEADEAWRRFRIAHPDYVVQPTERARPAGERAD